LEILTALAHGCIFVATGKQNGSPQISAHGEPLFKGQKASLCQDKVLTDFLDLAQDNKFK
jgi:hypothetical protein